MDTETTGHHRRLALFGIIYFVEGIVLTYFSTFNALYLRSFDISFTRIGIIGGITLIPFVLKILIGLLSDRVNLAGLGHRKPYIILGLVLQAIAFLLIPLISPVTQFPLLVVASVLAALGMSTYDTCTDGLSIDVTPEDKRGLVQGIMVGGRALSGIVAAAAIGFLSERGLWPTVFILIGGLGLLPIPLVLTVAEPKVRPPGKEFALSAFRSFLDSAFLLFIILGLAYPLVIYSANGMLGTFLHEELGVGLAQVGLYTSVFGIGAVVGGLMGGPLVSRIGRRASLTSALMITSVATVGLAVIPSAGLAWAIVSLFGVAFGYYETVYMAIGMDFSDPRIAAFMFAFVMAAGNLGIGLGAPLAGTLVDSVGFRWMFGVLAIINILSLPLIYGIFRLRKDLG
ncbi:MAG: MFS transporter [Chloroflexota bacterium]|nr:MFS transporter [Chloroflexota bacterium]